MLLINVGLKLDSAVMLDGRLLRGASVRAFLFGEHEADQGLTLDQTASGFAILSNLGMPEKRMPKSTDPEHHLKRLAEDVDLHDKKSIPTFQGCGKALGRAVSQLVPILAPQIIILAGQVVRLPDYVDGDKSKLESVDTRVEQCSFTTMQSAIQLSLNRHVFNDRLEIDHPALAWQPIG